MSKVHDATLVGVPWYRVISRYIIVAFLWPSLSRAQPGADRATTATLDAGVSSILVDGYTASQAATVTSRLWTTTTIGGATQVAGSADGALSRFTSGRLTAYGDGAVAIDFDTATAGWPTWDIAGGTGAYRGSTSGQYISTGVRWGQRDVVHAGGISVGWSGRGDIGKARIIHLYDTRHAGLEASARWQGFVTVLSVDLQHAGEVSYTDATASTAWRTDIGIQAQLTAGIRTGTRIGGRRQWLDVSGMIPLVGRNALTVSAGTLPPDPGQAVLGAKYATVAVHMAWGNASSHIPLMTPQHGASAGTAVSDLERDGSRTLMITVRATSTVEVMGDFTNWRPLALTRTADGRWAAQVGLGPGSHRINVRVDGGPWRVPPGLPAIPDDFGSLVGLLVVQ